MAPNPLLSSSARQRRRELRVGALAIGTLVDWREASADESLTITELTRLDLGQKPPVGYRPAHLDHYVAMARDADPAEVQQIIDRIADGQNA